MTQTRTLALAFAVIAMLGAPLLQQSAEAQGRRGWRDATGGRGGGRTAVPRPAGRVASAPRPVGRVAPAQRPGGRVVPAQRPGGRVVVAPRRGGVVIGAYYQPRYYSPFYSPFYNQFYGPRLPYRYGPYGGYGYYSPYGYGQFYGPESALRLQVTPRSTEVFVDGYYAGVVDDFDGIFQRLRLEPGEHDLALSLPGYRTVTQQVLLQPNRTLSMKYAMVPLAPGQAPEPSPVATSPGLPEESYPPVIGVEGADANVSFGAIAVRVQPVDADVWIDGERWDGPAADEALVLQIAPGPHRIEVRKDGYRGYAAQIDVRAGQTAPINVSLPRE
jgi:hypothetical protein